MESTIAASPVAARRPAPAPDPSRALVAALRSPACYPHPADGVEVIETHISYVLLAGDFAYKIKKPVHLPFVDFSSLESRRRYCEEEVRLNRRTAGALYLDVVAVAGPPSAPRFGGAGAAIEYAVRMRRFRQEDLLDRLAREGRLTAAHVDALARRVADFHASLPPGPRGRGFATPERILEQALANFRDIEAGERGAARLRSLEALRAWTLERHRALAPLFAERRNDGFVRECHGDLHLANVVLLEGDPVPFDCIEFDESLRCIDVMSEVAFTVMDLERHGLPGFAARFLDAYLARTGDYPGLRLLRFYAAYRAMVRAKVACIRARQGEPGEGGAGDLSAYLALAQRLAHGPRPALILMHGVSGSGKTRLSQQLLEATGAVRLRSDVERKRLRGLDPAARTGSLPGQGLYGERANALTYGRLAELASWVLASGFPAIVDATFLRRAERDAFRALASGAGASFTIVSCEAPVPLLRRRVVEREREGADASEAGLAVLALQLARREPLARDEAAHVVTCDSSGPDGARGACAEVLRRLRPVRH
ncbi:MAG TPA: AAA family ATPase [Usitatibacter sp.]|nr:AAA family ATPase [Usitatibacter sp.]